MKSHKFNKENQIYTEICNRNIFTEDLFSVTVNLFMVGFDLAEANRYTLTNCSRELNLLFSTIRVLYSQRQPFPAVCDY